MNLVVDDTDHPLIIKVASIPTARMQVYFIDNEDYFQRKAVLKDKNGKYFKDNDERAIFFCRGVLETVRKLGWAPDIIHCHGWFTSLLPLYVKKLYADDPHFADSKVVFSAYQSEFSGSLDPKLIEKLKFDGFDPADISEISEPTFENLHKLAFKFSDGIVEGSQELATSVDAAIKDSGKTVLPYCEPASCVKAYSDFYDGILQDSTVLVD
jgi:starch synthase